MAKIKVEKIVIIPTEKKTSIGNSVNSRPTNKAKRRSFKSYRGQGKK